MTGSRGQQWMSVHMECQHATSLLEAMSLLCRSLTWGRPVGWLVALTRKCLHFDTTVCGRTHCETEQTVQQVASAIAVVSDDKEESEGKNRSDVALSRKRKEEKPRRPPLPTDTCITYREVSETRSEPWTFSASVLTPTPDAGQCLKIFTKVTWAKLSTLFSKARNNTSGSR